MSVLEKLFESTAHLGKPLFIAFSVTFLVLLLVLLVYARKCSVTKKSEIERAPLKHWDEYTDKNETWYALPAKAKLLNLDHSQAGSVAENLSSFVTNSSLVKIVEDYFYGTIDTRTALWAKVIAVSYDSQYITIETETGNRFLMKRPNKPLTVSAPPKSNIEQE